MRPGALYELIVVFIIAFYVIWALPGLVAAHEATVDQAQMVLVVMSEKSFTETLETFKEEITRAGWSVLNSKNLAAELSEQCFALHPVVILDISRRKYSLPILSNDTYRPISALMPFRVSIYQTSDGKAFIARMNTNAFASVMPPEVAEVMSASDEEIAKIIADTVR